MMTGFSHSHPYERALSLYREAKRRYDMAIGELHEPIPHKYHNYIKSVGARADRERLETLQKKASELYDRIASLRPVVEFLVASARDLEVLVPEFMGLRAKRVQAMAAEIQGWVAELRIQLDEMLRLADEWQFEADRWEEKLMSESPEDAKRRWIEEELAAERRWIEEELAKEVAMGWAALERIARDAGFSSWAEYEDTLPD